MSTQTTTEIEVKKQDEESTDQEMGDAEPKPIPKVKVRPPNLADPHSRMVTLHVGPPPTSTTFTVHLAFITHYSPYFAAMLRPGQTTQESETLVVNLPETTPAAFGLFNRWLFTQSLADPFAGAASINDLIHLWFLASLAQIPALQNTVTREIHSHEEKFELLNKQDFRGIYSEKTKGMLIVEFLVYTMGKYVDKIAVPDYVPKEMLLEIYVVACHTRAGKREGRPHRVSAPGRTPSRFLVEEPGGRSVPRVVSTAEV